MGRRDPQIILMMAFGLTILTGCDGGCSKQKVDTKSATNASPTVEPAPQAQKVAIESTQTAASAKEVYGLDQSLPVVALVSGGVNGVDSKTSGTIAIDAQLQAWDSTQGVDGATSISLLEDSCTSGKYTAKLLGSGFELAKDVDYTNGSFKVAEAPKKHEVMIELSCGLRCIVQAGQKGVLCNQVADSVLDAFEVALGRSVYDPVFSGVKLAKVASSIVDASLIKGDETEAFRSAITTCSTKFDGAEEAQCFTSAIKNSPFYPSFKIMQQLAEGWTAEGLYSYVTTVLGASVEIDSELYGWIMDSLETALQTNFVTETRKVLANVVIAQNANEPRYPFQVVCNLELGSSSKKFKPDLLNDKLICNRTQAIALLTSAGIAASFHEAILKGELRESVECTDEGGYTDQSGKKVCWARLSMRVESLAQEVDRNDPSGTKRKPPTRSISMVDVMPQVMNDIRKANLPLGDGPFPDLNADQKKQLQEILGKRKDFFLGMIGIYRLLNDPELRSIKLSLMDLHEIFSDKRFLNTRIVGWGPGLSGVQVVDPSSKNSRYLDPLMKSVAGQNQTMTTDDQFRFNPSSGFQQRQVDLVTATTLAQQAALDFKQTFDLFTRIPTSREIERYTFDASRHEEWNPVGSRILNVAQLKNTGKPIYCRLVDPGPNLSFASATKVECDSTAEGISCGVGGLEEGQCTLPATYSYPFVLMERGWFGEGQGRLFMLASRSNGRPIGGGGQNGDGIMVREVKAGNAAGECDTTQKDKVVQYISRFQCGDNKSCQQNVTAFCMNLSDFGREARRRFYPGGVHKVTWVNFQTGETNTWDVPRIGVNTPGKEHATNTSACLHVASGTFTDSASGANANLAVNRVNTQGDLSLAGVASAAIKDCGESAATGVEKYILFSGRDFSATETPYAYLMTTRNDTLMWSQAAVNDGQWERNYARLSQVQIEGLLSGKKIMGQAETNIDGLKYVNPAHDPKFDPYCDDVNGNGVCDCFGLENQSSDGQTVQFSTQIRSDSNLCGLRDKAAEPTIAQLPYCSTCPDGAKAAQFFEAYGGKSGSALASANTFFGSSYPSFDVNSAAFCLHRFSGDKKQRSPRWVNFRDLGGRQDGCPAAEGDAYLANSSGPIRIINPKPMNNAFLIDKPRQVLQLVNYSLKSIGQGVIINRDEDLFATDEAYALLQLRLMMPPDQIRVVDSQNRVMKDVSLMFRSVDLGNDDSTDILSGALKGILLKAGKLTDQDLLVKRSEGGK